MKLSTSVLFLFLTIFLLIAGILLYKDVLDIVIHDARMVVGYMQLAFLLAFLSGITSFVYYAFKKNKRPLSEKLGNLHFLLVLLGIFSLFISVKSTFYTINNAPANEFYVHYFNTELITLIIGFFLVILSVLIFLYAIIKAMKS